MFEIGFWELVMVGVVALIVVGPERLPGLARTAGLWLGKARRVFAEVKAEVDRELHLEELKQTLRQQAELGEVKEIADQMKSLRADMQAELDRAKFDPTEFDDPGPPPGWQPEPSNAPPPPGWTPPVSKAEPPLSPSVSLQKAESPAPAIPSPPESVPAPTTSAPPVSPSAPPPPTAN